MSGAPLLAFAAGAAGVAGCWEALVAAERADVVERLRRAADPLRRAGAEGRSPTAAERRRLGVLAALTAFAGGWLAAGPVLGALAAASGPAIVLAIARWRAGRYAERLCAGAPAVARALADAVAAGHAVPGAIAVASTSIDGPARRELAAAARALELGERTEEALARLRGRARSRAWDTLTAALLLQRDAGGDLPSLLRRLAVSLEAGERARRDARTATAQARFSAWLVAGMPVAAAGIVELASPGFLAGLAAHPVSGPLLAGAAVLQVAGLLAIRRVAR